MILYRHTAFKGGDMSRRLLINALEDYCTKKEIISRNQSVSFFLSVSSKGKPFLKDYPHVHFSISHSGSLWFCGVQEQPLGIDIEARSENDDSEEKQAKQLDRFMKISGRFFAEQEQDFVRHHGEAGFYEVWVRKEAFIKCRGTGISEVLSSFSVITDNQPAEMVRHLHLEEISLAQMAYGAYCSSIPMAMEDLISLEA